MVNLAIKPSANTGISFTASEQHASKFVLIVGLCLLILTLACCVVVLRKPLLT